MSPEQSHFTGEISAACEFKQLQARQQLKWYWKALPLGLLSDVFWGSGFVSCVCDIKYLTEWGITVKCPLGFLK